MGAVSIYGLKAKDSDHYFYVGSTKRDPKVRFRQHLDFARLGCALNKHLGRKINKTGGKFVEIDILETRLESERYTRECAWISKLIAEDHPLLNILLTPVDHQRFVEEEKPITWSEFIGKVRLLADAPLLTDDEPNAELARAFERVSLKYLNHFITKCRPDLERFISTGMLEAA